MTPLYRMVGAEEVCDTPVPDSGIGGLGRGGRAGRPCVVLGALCWGRDRWSCASCQGRSLARPLAMASSNTAAAGLLSPAPRQLRRLHVSSPTFPVPRKLPPLPAASSATSPGVAAAHLSRCCTISLCPPACFHPCPPQGPLLPQRQHRQHASVSNQSAHGLTPPPSPPPTSALARPPVAASGFPRPLVVVHALSDSALLLRVWGLPPPRLGRPRAQLRTGDAHGCRP